MVSHSISSSVTASKGILFSENIDFESARKKIRAALKRAVDKYGLRGKKIRELSKKEKDELAMRLAGVTPEELRRR